MTTCECMTALKGWYYDDHHGHHMNMDIEPWVMLFIITHEDWSAGELYSALFR